VLVYTGSQTPNIAIVPRIALPGNPGRASGPATVSGNAPPTPPSLHGLNQLKYRNLRVNQAALTQNSPAYLPRDGEPGLRRGGAPRKGLKHQSRCCISFKSIPENKLGGAGASEP
jgi:hypothetical protein